MNNESLVQRGLVVARDVAQIIALFGVAVWTLYLQWPSLSGDVHLKSELLESRQVGDWCEATFRLALDNPGNRAAKAEKVEIRVWPFDQPFGDKEANQLISIAAFENATKPIIEKVIERTPLTVKTAPGEGRSDIFLISLQNTQNTVGRRIIFDVRVEATIGLVRGQTQLTSFFPAWVCVPPRPR